jgi:hypothetical protein
MRKAVVKDRKREPTHRGFFLITAPDARSSVDINFEIVAGTSLE